MTATFTAAPRGWFAWSANTAHDGKPDPASPICATPLAGWILTVPDPLPGPALSGMWLTPIVTTSDGVMLDASAISDPTNTTVAITGPGDTETEHVVCLLWREIHGAEHLDAVQTLVRRVLDAEAAR